MFGETNREDFAWLRKGKDLEEELREAIHANIDVLHRADDAEARVEELEGKNAVQTLRAIDREYELVELQERVVELEKWLALETNKRRQQRRRIAELEEGKALVLEAFKILYAAALGKIKPDLLMDARAAIDAGKGGA